VRRGPKAAIRVHAKGEAEGSGGGEEGRGFSDSPALAAANMRGGDVTDRIPKTKLARVSSPVLNRYAGRPASAEVKAERVRSTEDMG